MADAQEQAKIQPEVELDLDDVKETEVKIEEQQKEESKEANLNVGEVDLGYTDHDKEQPKEEVDVEEIEEPKQETQPTEDPDDLTKVSESVRKRIDKLTRRYRESERREKGKHLRSREAFKVSLIQKRNKSKRELEVQGRQQTRVQDKHTQESCT